MTCDPPALDVYEARDAKMVVEVLSPSNTGVTWQRKIEEYRRCDGLIYILFVDSRVTEATLLTRSAGGWEASDAEGPSAVIDLPQIGCRLAMSDVYEGVTL